MVRGGGGRSAIHAEASLDHVGHLVSFGTRRADQPECREAQESIETILGSLPFDEIPVQDFDGGADNVIAVLRGALRPERVHVPGAHHDSIHREGPTAPAFIRGDANLDGAIDISDPVRTLVMLFLEPPEGLRCPSSADADDSGTLEVSDAIFTLDDLFLAGSAPPAPFPICGIDPTLDSLGCPLLPPRP